MAVYNLTENNNNNKFNKNKKIGITLIAISSVCFFILLTSFVGFLKGVILGMIGLFAYPFFLTMMIIGVAFINNKKYIMTTKYIVYLSLCILFLLCVFHLLFIEKDLSFANYLQHSYQSKYTVFGAVGGLLTSITLFTINATGSYVVFSVLFVIFAALLADYIYYLNKNQLLKKPVKINENKKQNFDLETFIKKQSSKKQSSKKQEKILKKIQKKEKINIVLDSKIENEKNNISVKRRLGLIAGSELEEKHLQDDIKKPSKPKIDFNNKEDVKKYLLSKDSNINFDKYKISANNSNLDKNQISKNFEEIKNQNEEESSSVVSQNNYFAKTNQIVSPLKVEDNFAKEDFEDLEKQFDNQNNSIDDNFDYVNENPFNYDFDDKKQSVVSQNSASESSLSNAGIVPKENVQNVNEAKENISRKDYNPLIKDYKKNESTASTDIIKQIEREISPKKQVVYKRPPLDLLTTKSMDLSEISDDIMAKRELLENALETFGIPAKVIEVVVGPAVTRYELNMPIGISVKKLLSHQDDIALNLASNGNIRIEAPIPGKSAVGIEVPNQTIATVSLHDMIGSVEFQRSTAPLTFVLGKDINGKAKLCDLAKMPHLLVAGSTGSGKSVCLNAVILSLIYKTSPDDVRLILIDPKQVEFSIYNNLPHLLIPTVITETDKALNALTYAVNEMERRYTIFKNTRVRDIGEYSSSKFVQEGNGEKMPYIVIIIDELADLLMSSKKEAEEKIARLAQKARSAGIHLILATQRPSVDIITGTIKNNFTSRISFKLMSFADSKTIMDQSGAEKLLGKGDMLYKPSDASDARRIQCSFVTGTEVDNIVEFAKQNNQDFDYDVSIIDAINNPQTNVGTQTLNGNAEVDGYDSLMGRALKCVIDNNQATISMLQRRLEIGYPRAARIIDQMEKYKYVSVQEGSKPRTVLITKEEFEEKFGEI